jgi:uncharacterized membrane protein
VHHETTIEIAARPDAVWSTLTDVERWPEWTHSMTKVERLDNGDLGVGSRARIRQPGMPPLVWEVTELVDGQSFSWRSKVPGITTTGGHHLSTAGTDGRTVTVTLTLDHDGFLAPLVERLLGARSRRYVQMEADGLKARCEAGRPGGVGDVGP